MKIVKSNELAWAPALQQGPYGQRRKELGGEKLKASVFELAPGKASFPMHRHHVTEEALFVVSGHALVRTPEGDHPLSTGDFVSFPAGGAAHQLVNESAEPFVYVALSTNAAGADIVEYPRSEKIACAVGAFPTGQRYVFRKADQADYFDGEL